MVDDEAIGSASAALAAAMRSGEDMAHRLRRGAVTSRDAGPLPAMVEASATVDERSASRLGTYPHMPTVRFLADDRVALWDAGDLADDLGWESSLPEDHPHFVPIRLVRLHGTGEVIALTDPYGRGLIERVDP